MTKTNMQNISVEEIIKKIKQEVEKRENLSRSNEIDENTQNNLKDSKRISVAREELLFITKEIYEYKDFTKYHDEEFVKNSFKGLLKREVDIQGLNHYLTLLRTGQKSKTEIITMIRNSKEGKSKSVKLLGLKKRYIVTALYSLPLIGYILKSLVMLFTFPKLLKRLNSYENCISQELNINYKNDILLQDAINTKANLNTVKELENELEKKASQNTTQELWDELETKVSQDTAQKLWDELETKVNGDATKELWNALETKVNLNTVKELENELEKKAERTEFELYLQTVSYAKDYIKLSQEKMQELIDEAKKRLPKKILNKKELLAITDEEKHKFDALYVEFEDRFRGTRKDIKSRMEVYLPYLENLSFIKTDMDILDVGCGRGEWLELLVERGYKNVNGIDLNRMMVSISNELNLNVKAVDVIEYLVSLEDESLSVITGFHIIEHLPFEVLMTMYKESLRVLKKGGMIIFETPNPENILVAAHHFYTDPTHINPLVPVTTQFLVEQSGFINVEIKRLHKYSKYHEIGKDNELISDNFLNEMDYSIIGYKK